MNSLDVLFPDNVDFDLSDKRLLDTAILAAGLGETPDVHHAAAGAEGTTGQSHQISTAVNGDQSIGVVPMDCNSYSLPEANRQGTACIGQTTNVISSSSPEPYLGETTGSSDCFRSFTGSSSDGSPNKHKARAAWTKTEDDALREAVKVYGAHADNWPLIAKAVPGRGNKSCRKRWFHTLDPELRRGPWTSEEDAQLRRAVEQYGQLWSQVARTIPGRRDDQCAKRWREALDPNIDRTQWTPEDDRLLFQAIRELGSQWQKIATTYFPNRPGMHCRNRWRRLMRNKVGVRGQKRHLTDNILFMATNQANLLGHELNEKPIGQLLQNSGKGDSAPIDSLSSHSNTVVPQAKRLRLNETGQASEGAGHNTGLVNRNNPPSKPLEYPITPAPSDDKPTSSVELPVVPSSMPPSTAGLSRTNPVPIAPHPKRPASLILTPSRRDPINLHPTSTTTPVTTNAEPNPLEGLSIPDLAVATAASEVTSAPATMDSFLSTIDDSLQTLLRDATDHSTELAPLDSEMDAILSNFLSSYSMNLDDTFSLDHTNLTDLLLPSNPALAGIEGGSFNLEALDLSTHLNLSAPKPTPAVNTTASVGLSGSRTPDPTGKIVPFSDVLDKVWSNQSNPWDNDQELSMSFFTELDAQIKKLGSLPPSTSDSGSNDLVSPLDQSMLQQFSTGLPLVEDTSESSGTAEADKTVDKPERKPLVSDSVGEEDQQLRQRLQDLGLSLYGCAIEQCGKAFRTPSELQQHAKTHHVDHPQLFKDPHFRPFCCAMNGCFRTYKNINGLQYHIFHSKGSVAHFHPAPDGSINEDLCEDRPYKCTEAGCRKKYKNANGLQYHRIHSHGLTPTPSATPEASSSTSPVRPSAPLARSRTVNGSVPRKATPRKSHVKSQPVSPSMTHYKLPLLPNSRTSHSAQATPKLVTVSPALGSLVSSGGNAGRSDLNVVATGGLAPKEVMVSPHTGPVLQPANSILGRTSTAAGGVRPPLKSIRPSPSQVRPLQPSPPAPKLTITVSEPTSPALNSLPNPSRQLATSAVTNALNLMPPPPLKLSGSSRTSTLSTAASRTVDRVPALPKGSATQGASGTLDTDCALPKVPKKNGVGGPVISQSVTPKTVSTESHQNHQPTTKTSTSLAKEISTSKTNASIRKPIIPITSSTASSTTNPARVDYKSGLASLLLSSKNLLDKIDRNFQPSNYEEFFQSRPSVFETITPLLQKSRYRGITGYSTALARGKKDDQTPVSKGISRIASTKPTTTSSVSSAVTPTPPRTAPARTSTTPSVGMRRTKTSPHTVGSTPTVTTSTPTRSLSLVEAKRDITLPTSTTTANTPTPTRPVSVLQRSLSVSSDLSRLTTTTSGENKPKVQATTTTSEVGTAKQSEGAKAKTKTSLPTRSPPNQRVKDQAAPKTVRMTVTTPSTPLLSATLDRFSNEKSDQLSRLDVTKGERRVAGSGVIHAAMSAPLSPVLPPVDDDDILGSNVIPGGFRCQIAQCRAGVFSSVVALAHHLELAHPLHLAMESNRGGDNLGDETS
ncbi:hypothetical protein IWQ62_001484 [Dispira parvispora]|uniref:Uncharacterized protein n=1 Tax=Dispira parvispora TaxID=1520584 RepID=A0A9W8AY88_9FUNG|nr:hypothetical protein IWQ62_001484 [Dispira parvispora]